MVVVLEIFVFTLFVVTNVSFVVFLCLYFLFIVFVVVLEGSVRSAAVVLTRRAAAARARAVR